MTIILVLLVKEQEDRNVILVMVQGKEITNILVKIVGVVVKADAKRHHIAMTKK